MSKSAGRIYVKQLLLALAVYLLVLAVSITLLNASPHSAWWRIPLAVTPMVPAIFMMLAVMRFYNRMDELQRRMQLEALAFGFAGTAILTFSYGFLEGVGFPHLSWLFVWPLMGTLWILGKVIARRRYS